MSSILLPLTTKLISSVSTVDMCRATPGALWVRWTVKADASRGDSSKRDVIRSMVGFYYCSDGRVDVGIFFDTFFGRSRARTMTQAVGACGMRSPMR